jgi:type II secretory pathway pseudopilin PulG
MSLLLVGLVAYAIDIISCESPRQITRGYMGVIKDATEAYFQKKHRYPEVTSAKDSGAQLYQQLAACPESADRIRDLPREAFSGPPSAPPVAFVDVWGTPIRYELKGFAKDQPVLISAGPDGDFGDADPKGAEDNLRSDSN